MFNEICFVLGVAINLAIVKSLYRFRGIASLMFNINSDERSKTKRYTNIVREIVPIYSKEFKRVAYLTEFNNPYEKYIIKSKSKVFGKLDYQSTCVLRANNEMVKAIVVLNNEIRGKFIDLYFEKAIKDMTLIMIGGYLLWQLFTRF